VIGCDELAIPARWPSRLFSCAIGSIREATRKVAALTIFHVIFGAGGTVSIFGSPLS
jgi:hypothetical protein